MDDIAVSYFKTFRLFGFFQYLTGIPYPLNFKKSTALVIRVVTIILGSVSAVGCFMMIIANMKSAFVETGDISTEIGKFSVLYIFSGCVYMFVNGIYPMIIPFWIWWTRRSVLLDLNDLIAFHRRVERLVTEKKYGSLKMKLGFKVLAAIVGWSLYTAVCSLAIVPFVKAFRFLDPLVTIFEIGTTVYMEIYSSLIRFTPLTLHLYFAVCYQHLLEMIRVKMTDLREARSGCLPPAFPERPWYHQETDNFVPRKLLYWRMQLTTLQKNVTKLNKMLGKLILVDFTVNVVIICSTIYSLTKGIPSFMDREVVIYMYLQNCNGCVKHIATLIAYCVLSEGFYKEVNVRFYSRLDVRARVTTRENLQNLEKSGSLEKGLKVKECIEISPESQGI